MKLGRVEIDVPDCPKAIPNVMGIPSWVIGWGLGISAVVILAIIIAIAAVRSEANTERNKTQRARLDTMRVLGPPKQCRTCGDVYDPEKAADKAEAKKKAGDW